MARLSRARGPRPQGSAAGRARRRVDVHQGPKKRRRATIGRGDRGSVGGMLIRCVQAVNPERSQSTDVRPFVIRGRQIVDSLSRTSRVHSADCSACHRTAVRYPAHSVSIFCIQRTFRGDGLCDTPIVPVVPGRPSRPPRASRRSGDTPRDVNDRPEASDI